MFSTNKLSRCLHRSSSGEPQCQIRVSVESRGPGTCLEGLERGDEEMGREEVGLEIVDEVLEHSGKAAADDVRVSENAVEGLVEEDRRHGA